MAVEKGNIKISYECSELIEELKQDIIEFGNETPVYVWVREDKDGIRLYLNYDFIEEDLPITDEEKELMELNGEHLETMTMGDLLPLLIKQNEII
jgi:hypothetical protein